MRMMAVLLFASLTLLAGTACADYDDDWESSQQCLDAKTKAGDHNAIECINRVLGYTDRKMSILKCSIRMWDQGLNLFQFPWFLLTTDEYLWLTVVKQISIRGFLDRANGSAIRTDCSRVGSLAYTLVGDYYWLRSLLFELGSVDMSSATLNLPAVQSTATIAEIEEIVSAIVGVCAALPDSVMRNSLWCVEAHKLNSYAGESTYEKFLTGLQRYQ